MKVHCLPWGSPTLRADVYLVPMFSLTKSSIRTDSQAREYVHEKYVVNAPDAEVDRVMSLYPDGNGFLTSHSFRC